ITNSQRMRERAVMISSTIPSAKYSCSGSPLILANEQYRYRGLVGERQCSRWSYWPLWHRRRANAIDAQRARNVLQALLADIGKLGLDLAAHLPECIIGDANAAGFGDPLQPCGDVDTVADDVVAFHQHVAEMDADAPFRAAIGGSGCVALRRQLLQPDLSLNSVDHRAELDQHAIAGGLDDTTAMVGDERICRGAVVAQCLRRARLVEPHQAAVACHISGKDRGELADCGHSSGIPALRRPAKYVASYRARIFGTPCHMRAFRCAMLEKRSLPFSLRASASSATARSISPLRA